MARRVRATPAELVAGWPDEPSGDPSAEVARRLALRLRQAMDGRSAREVGGTTGVDYSTVAAIIRGSVWPDLMTIARLEAGLGTDLYPAGVARSTEASRGIAK